MDQDQHGQLATGLGSVRRGWVCCAFYVTKKKAKNDPASLCPPILVFRGRDTQTEDFAELAMLVRLCVNYTIDMPSLSGLDDILGSLLIDTTFSQSPDYNGRTMADMATKDLTAEPLFVGAHGTGVRSIDGPIFCNVDINVDWMPRCSMAKAVIGR